jgi:hypothetical protein
MMIVLTMLIGFIVFDLVSWRWGINSTEDVNSREWDKRKDWGAI